MKPLRIGAITLSLLSIYPAPSQAADRFAVELATAPVWFFRDQSYATIGTCTAVNLHDKPITLTLELVVHDDDGFPRPIFGPVYDLKQVVGPGEATELTVDVGSYGFDAHMVRCVFKFRGNPNLVKGTVILEDSPRFRMITAPAEIARKVLLARPESVED